MRIPALPVRLSLCTFLALPGAAWAVPLVQWGPSDAIVSTIQGMSEGEDDPTLNPAAASNPAIGANYYQTAAGLGTPNTSGLSPVFFANTCSSNATNSSALLINNASTGSDVLRSANYSVTGGATVHSLVLWQRFGSGTSTTPVFGFLNGGDDASKAVTLTNLSATAYVNANSSSSTLENRFVIRLGNTFYISQDAGDFASGSNSTAATTLSIAAPASVTWYAFDPAADIRVIGGAVSLASFENLTAVGIWYVRSTTLTNTNINYVSYTAEGTISDITSNTPPVANNDTATATSGSSVLIPVLSNDTDADGDALSVSAVTAPGSGSAVIDGNQVRYTAPAGFTGVDSFSYTVSDGVATGSATVTVTVSGAPVQPDSAVGDGRSYRFYFVGNSLSRGLSLASGQDRARLEGIFRTRGSRMIFGTQLGAGVNLDEHWSKIRLSTGQALTLTHMDDLGETSVSDGISFAFSFFRDYVFAFQGFQRDWDGAILSGNTFDGVILQPYQSLLEVFHYTTADQAKGFRGDRAAIRDFIRYASGNNPQNHRATGRFYIYSAWPRLEGIEGRAADPDGDGVYSFSEFYSAAYTVPSGGVPSQNIGQQVPSRDFVSQLVAGVKADHPDLASEIYLIPVGEVFAAVDELIRTNQLPGIAGYFTRNAAYYLEARLDGLASLADAGFTYLYPPGEPANFGSDFIAAQGVKNFYCDKVHMNDQTHNDERSGTIGAYLAAATVHCVLTGDRPGRLTAAQVAALYEKFDAVQDAALIARLQQTIWDVVTADSRTGVVALPDELDSYPGFQAAHFDAAEIAAPAISGEGADADGDGVPNVLEFFRQTDPRQQGGAGGGWTLQPLGSDYKASLRGLSRSAGLLPRFEVSSDLANWSAVPDADVLVTPAPDAGMSDYEIVLAGGQPRAFCRLNLAFLPTGAGTPLVAWGPATDIVSSNINLSGGSLALDLVNPSSPAPGGTYQAASPIFHVAAGPLEPGVSLGTFRIGDGGAAEDILTVSFSKNTAAANAGSASILWQQATAFLNGANTGDVTLGRLRVRAKQNSSTTGVTQLRFVIRKGSQFYISEDCGAISTNTLFEEITLANPAAARWFAFDPAQTGTVGAPVYLSDFGAITAVGFNWRCHATGTTQTLSVSEFTAERVGL